MYVKNDRWQFCLLSIKSINYRNLVNILKTYHGKSIFTKLANTSLGTAVICGARANF